MGHQCLILHLVFAKDKKKSTTQNFLFYTQKRVLSIGNRTSFFIHTYKRVLIFQYWLLKTRHVLMRSVISNVMRWDTHLSFFVEVRVLVTQNLLCADQTNSLALACAGTLNLIATKQGISTEMKKKVLVTYNLLCAHGKQS